MIDFSDITDKVVCCTRNKDYFKQECRNILTKDLDKMADMNYKVDGYDVYHHYCLTIGEDNLIAIRVPGGTVGSIEFDPETKKIIDVEVDTNYVVKTYWRHVNKHIKEKYIGMEIEFREGSNEE